MSLVQHPKEHLDFFVSELAISPFHIVAYMVNEFQQALVHLVHFDNIVPCQLFDKAVIQLKLQVSE